MLRFRIGCHCYVKTDRRQTFLARVQCRMVMRRPWAVLREEKRYSSTASRHNQQNTESSEKCSRPAMMEHTTCTRGEDGVRVLTVYCVLLAPTRKSSSVMSRLAHRLQWMVLWSVCQGAPWQHRVVRHVAKHTSATEMPTQETT
ncbi:hypothetical protein EYF80_026684 [Liparis tanakae]|uniref:Uncharacterized protein n=1 Tax=Liparis tanakae TaxID=230148 RepID=A0A4Z2HB13_9TELE|nr:hypothetical protein EYF80_026684 [Liparis tanakae]